jgi:uncharacterized cupredoxin-like copper-binding protein
MRVADRELRSPRAGGLALVLLLLLSACAAKDVMAPDSSGYVADSERRVADIDWTKAETVDVALSEYDFTPASLSFRQGHPYRLHLTNKGGDVHDFASKPFFQAIAAAKLVAPDATTTLPHLQSIGLKPGETKDLYFVAVTPGSYPFECREPLHAMFGMTGTARIE